MLRTAVLTMVAMLGCGGVAAIAQTAVAGSEAAPRPVLVELFTSEGCSSCPPADALLRELEGKRVGGGLVVALSEHVTYWNQLGWRDPFSLEAFTSRQNAYGERFRLDSVYTPQVVVDGEAQVLGSDGGAVRAAVAAAARAEITGTVRIARVSRAGAGRLGVKLAVEGVRPDAEWFAVIADDRAQSSVARGENAGRSLVHVAVARGLIRLKEVGKGDAEVEVPWPAELPQTAGAGHHVVVFAQEPGSGRVLALASAAIAGPVTAAAVDRAAAVR